MMKRTYALVAAMVLAVSSCRKASGRAEEEHDVAEGARPTSSSPSIESSPTGEDVAVGTSTTEVETPFSPCAPPVLVLHDSGLEKVALDPGIEGDVTASKITSGNVDSDRRIAEILRAPIRDEMDLLRNELKEGAKVASIHGRCVATWVRPELAAVRCDLDTFAGGPYPNTGTRGAGVRVCGRQVRPIALSDLCGPRCVEAASAAISERLRRRLGAAVQSDLNGAVEEGEPLLQQFAIGPRGLTVSLTWLLPHVDGDERIVDVPGPKLAGALDGKDDALIKVLRAAWTKR